MERKYGKENEKEVKKMDGAENGVLLKGRLWYFDIFCGFVIF